MNIKKRERLTRVFVLGGTMILCNALGTLADTANRLRPAKEGEMSTQQLVTSNSMFAINLYHQLAAENPGKNLVFSPFSTFTGRTKHQALD